MSSEFVFVTGATGFIGLHVLQRTLLAGHRARAAIRTASGEQRIISALKSSGLDSTHLSNLSFVVVPDITTDSAYSGPGILDNIQSIIHVASPLAQAADDYKRDLIDPAVNGTTNILNAALSHGNIRRVVITSSIATMLDLPTMGYNSPLTEADKATTVDYDNKTSNPYVAYCSSKILAQKATQEFLDAHPYGKGRSFDVVTIHPAFVMGHNYVQTEYSEPTPGTNRVLWDIVSPTASKTLDPTPAATVSVIDVAQAHVNALTIDTPNKDKVEEFLLSTPWEQVKYDTTAAVVKKLAEEDEEVKSVLGELVFKDKVGVEVVNDVSKSEKVLGIKYRSFEDQVRDIVKQQARLYKARPRN